MHRVLFAFGSSYMAVQLCAAFLPRALLLPAAFFVAVLLLLLKRAGKQGYPVVVSVAAITALLLFMVQIHCKVQPLEQLAGKSYALTAYVDEVKTGYIDGTVQATLSVTRISGKETNFRAVCDALPDSEPGEIVEGIFFLEALPKDEQWAGHYADNIYLVVKPVSNVQWKIGQPRWIDRLRSLRVTLAKEISRVVPKPYSRIVAAMSVGDKTKLTQQDRALFRTAGLSHLLVVSGLHLTLLCGILLREDRFHGLFRRVRGMFSLLLVICLMGITGFTPSICRAGIMAIVYDIGQIFLLPSDGLTSLGFSALLLCGLNCYAACDVGLQLSYSATLGVLFAAQLLRRQNNVLPERRTRADRVRIILLRFFAPSFFSAVCTFPVQLWHGMAISGVSLLANILAMWIVSPLLVCGAMCALLGCVPHLEVLARLFALLAAAFCRLLVGVASFCASLPFARLHFPKEYTLFVWMLLFLLALLFWRGRKFYWLWAVAPCFVLAAALCTHTLQKNVAELTLVGSSNHPCAVIIQDRKSMVLLRGGQKDALAVQTCLNQYGIEKADLLVDLRQDTKGKQSICPTEQYVSLENLPQYGTARYCVGQMNVSVLNQPKGNLAILQIDGYRIAIGAGRPWLSDCPVDLLIAGESLPQGIKPSAILMTSTKYTWMKNPPHAKLLYSEEEPILRLRPGSSCRLFEVSDVTHTTSS